MENNEYITMDNAFIGNVSDRGRGMVRKAIHLVLIIVLTAALSACGMWGDSGNQDDTDKKASDRKVDLTVWAFMDSGMDLLAEKYMSKHPNVRITVMPNMYNDFEGLKSSITAEDGVPDIVLTEEFNLALLRRNPELLQNLADYGADEISNEYLDSIWSQVVDEDENAIYGLPLSAFPYVMVYRPDVFEKSGLPTEPDQVGQQLDTWDKYMEAGKQLASKTGKAMITNIQDLYDAISIQSTELYYSNDGETMIAENSPAVQRAWNLSVAAHDNKLSGKLYNMTMEYRDAILNGDVATGFVTSFDLNFLKTNVPEGKDLWKIASIPEGGYVSGDFVVIPRQSKYPREAYEFMKWLTSAPQQLTLFKEKGLFPSASEAIQDSDVALARDPYFGNISIGSLFTDAVQRSDQAPIAGDKFHMIHGYFTTALQDVEQNNVPPAQAWNDAITNIKQQVSNSE